VENIDHVILGTRRWAIWAILDKLTKLLILAMGGGGGVISRPSPSCESHSQLELEQIMSK
jgi:hypothetical protein